MKLFHTENGKEVVYAQMKDIVYLYEKGIPTPESIFSKVFTGWVVIKDSNRYNFIRFEEEEEVEFFKRLDFIIDYDKYKIMSDEQLEEKAQELTTQINNLSEKWNNMPIEEQKENRELISKINNICYMYYFIAEVYAVKHGNKHMPFPEFDEE